MPTATDDVVLIDPALLPLLTPAERARYRRYLIQQAVKEDRWQAWLPAIAPAHVEHEFAPHHVDYWNWLWGVRQGVKAAPFIAVWPRGGAKSTSAEIGVVALGARKVRRYCIYVCDTQDQADDHVANIGGLLESHEVAVAYPEMAARRVTKFGHSRGWRRNRLWTESGFVVDALGLDTAARGRKLMDQRPDVMVLDDVDAEHDTERTTEKKIASITKKLLPAGSSDLLVLGVQNLVIPHGVFARLANLTDPPADFLAGRIVSGPVPAAYGLEYERREGAGPDGTDRWVVTAGEAAWPGQSLEVIEHQLNEWGPSSFLTEAQHEVHKASGGMFDHLDFNAMRVDWDDVPWKALLRTVVWVDPAVSNTDASDAYAIHADAITADRRNIYRLRSWEQRTNPDDALERAIIWAAELGADHVGVESDQGGDTWQVIYRSVGERLLRDRVIKKVPRFKSDKASKQPGKSRNDGSSNPSKVGRAQEMLAVYEDPSIRVWHVRGSHLVLEDALSRFPREKPYDLVDAATWSIRDLTGKLRSKGSVGNPSRRKVPQPDRR